MSRDIGDFGVVHEPYDETFGYFGQRLRVHPDLSDLALVEFAALGDGLGEETTGSEANAAVMGVFRTLVHPEDFDAFWSTSKANRQSMDDLMVFAEKVIEAVTERPTEQLSNSSDGQPSTETNSVVVSTSPVVRRLEVTGRGDLAHMVVLAQEFASA